MNFEDISSHRGKKLFVMFPSFSPHCSKFFKLVFNLEFLRHEEIWSCFSEGNFGCSGYASEVFCSSHLKILSQRAIRGPQTSIVRKHHVNSDADVPWNIFSFPYLKSLIRRTSCALSFSIPLSFHSTSFSNLLLPMEVGYSIWMDLCYLHAFAKLTNKTCIFSFLLFALPISSIWARIERQEFFCNSCFPPPLFF